jgi:cation/acetate symporter
MEPFSRSRMINPHLGTYFGIFVSAFAAVTTIALILEQLGASEFGIRILMFAAPLALFGIFAGAVATDAPRDFFAAGRRIPPFFAGLVLAVVAFGGIGVVSLTGAIFHMGVDGLVLTSGIVAGLLCMGVLVSPFLRKAGNYTVPGFLAQRVESRTVRVAAAALLIVPVALMCVAELRIAALAAARLLDLPEGLLIPAVTAVAAGIVVGGGMRSATWSSAAKAIVALIALSIPVTVVASMVSGLPFPQMVHGNFARAVARLEVVRGMPTLISEPLLLALPPSGLEPISKQFLQSFGSIGPIAFVFLLITIMAGVAGMPTLLHRPGCTPGVHAARKSIGWAVVIVGFAALTAAAVAVFMRGLLIEQVVGTAEGSWPSWFQLLRQLGMADVADKLKPVGISAISMDRDAVAFALPIAAGLPAVGIYLVYAGALAAALAALCAGLVTIGTILGEDVVTGLVGDTPSDRVRVVTARLGIGVAALSVMLLAAFRIDPLQLALVALSIAGPTTLPAVLLSIFWKRLSALGLLAGMAAGFGTSVVLLLLAEAGLGMAAVPVPAVIGLIAGFAAAIGVSMVTPGVSRHALEFVRDFRVPGGETIFDRRVRLERLRRLGEE